MRSRCFFGVCLLVLLGGCGKGGREEVPAATPTPVTSLVEPKVTKPAPQSEYQASLGLAAEQNKDSRVELISPTPTPTPEPVQTEPTYPVGVNIFGWTAVPDKNLDGSSCKEYLSGVSLVDAGTFWGTHLTEDDFFGGGKYLVGVEQNPDDEERGNLQSVGWLANNLGKMKAEDAVKFTNLHVIGHLSDEHLALLCSYDWYSVHGLDDTLVIFEDISGTLRTEDFKEGDIFSATVFVHNVKVEDNLNGKRVVVVEYDIFR